MPFGWHHLHPVGVSSTLVDKLTSTVAAACIALLLFTAIIAWNHEDPYRATLQPMSDFLITPQKQAPQSQFSEQYQQSESLRRFLQDVAIDPPAFNDDITRDETCKQYIFKFLNGTTDFKDECQGMYNAYEAADCADDTHTVIYAQSFAQTRRHHHKKDDNNSTDDDNMIDDFYEHWECCNSIYDYYNTHCHEPQLDSSRLLGIVGVLVVCSLVKSFIHQVMNLEWLPDAAINVLVGGSLGAVLRLVAPDVVAKRLIFNNDLFLHILLPPIVFQAALKIDKRSFRRDVFPILSFAILGTVFSAIAVGLSTFYLSKLGNGTHLPLMDSLLFGSLISSIDPVATLGILSSVGVSQRDTLYTLIFGESLLNDGVAIVLFDTLLNHLGDASVVEKATVMEILGKFLGIACGSILVGVICGACCAIYFYNLWGKHSAVTEVAIFFSWALIPFYLSDMMGGSGIIAIMVMGFFLDYYVVGGNQSEEREWMDFMQLRCTSNRNTNNNHSHRFPNERIRSEGDLLGVQLPELGEPSRWDHLKMACCRTFSGRGHILSKSRHHVGFVAEVVAEIMETAIFAYLGVFLFNDNNAWDWKLNIVAIFGCISSRLAMVALISLLINICVFTNLEAAVCRYFHKIWSDLTTPRDCNNQRHAEQVNPHALAQSARTAMSEPLLAGHYDDPPTRDEDLDDDDDNSTSSVSRRFLDMKTQLMLLLAGVRGAVSFALVANVPVYNIVTKHGSQYKSELKDMTSSSIIFTLFVFGALTYFIVRNDDSDPNERIVGNLTHRLASMPLASDNEGEEDDSDGLASSLRGMELEDSPPGRRTGVI